MSKIDDGGPAFAHGGQPNDPKTHTAPAQRGMSRRDYFAGQALAGMVANPMYDNNSPANVAQQAYVQADAMVREAQPE